MQRQSLGAAVAVLLLMTLGACVPVADAPQVGVAQLTEPISYYPFQTGAYWEYLPERAKLTDPRTRVAVTGPTVLAGQIWTEWYSRGRGLEQSSYRDSRPDGVYLLREERLGTTFVFDPPLREYPAPGSLREGSTWSGTSTVKLQAEWGRDEYEIQYTYTVVDERKVTVPAGEFMIFAIDFVASTYDEDGVLKEELTQQSWFAPYVGEVMLRSGHVLVGSNVVGAVTAETP